MGRAIKGTRTLLLNKELPCRTIQVRPSMIKVDADRSLPMQCINSLEIVGTRYCECFASGIYCDGANCNCVNCYNNVENEAARREAVEANLEGNPNAFRPKFAGSPHATRDSMPLLIQCRLFHMGPARKGILLLNKEVEERSDEVYCQVLLVPEKELVERKLLDGESDADGEEEDADAVVKFTIPHMFCKTLTASDTSC